MSAPDGLVARLVRAIRPPKGEPGVAGPTGVGLSVLDQYDNYREKQAQAFLSQEYWLAPQYGMGRWSSGQLTEIRQCSRTGFGSTCVDAIVDRVASMEWGIVPKDQKKYDKAHVAKVKAFFDNPNQNEESFGSILRAITRGILETDDGSLEKVFDRYENQTVQFGAASLTASVPAKNAKLKEIFVVDGSTFYKICDEHGYLAGYWQVVNFAKAKYFDKRQIVYMMMNPIPGSVYGRSLFMAIAEELELLVKARRLNASLFNNLAMPGVHVDYPDPLMEQAALDKIKREFDAKYVTEGKRFGSFFTKGGVKVETLSFSPQQLQSIELQQLLQKIVMAKLKVTPAMLGFTEDVNRATATSQRREFRDRTLFPLLRLIEYHLNMQVISEFGYDDIEFKFISEADLDDELERARIDEIYLKYGVKVPNEVREEQGREPVDWGEVPYQPPAAFGAPTKLAKSAAPKISDALQKELKDIIEELRARFIPDKLNELRRELLELAKTAIRDSLTEAATKAFGAELPSARLQEVEVAIDQSYRDFVKIFESEVLRLSTVGRNTEG